jgi:hypothetical protein
VFCKKDAEAFEAFEALKTLVKTLFCYQKDDCKLAVSPCKIRGFVNRNNVVNFGDCPLKIVPKLLLLAETMLTTMSS